MSTGFTVDLANLLDVADQCLPDIDGNLQFAENTLSKTEADHTQAFDDSAAKYDTSHFSQSAVPGQNNDFGGLYAQLADSFQSLRAELVTVMQRLRTNLEESEQALRQVHDRYARADGQ